MLAPGPTQDFKMLSHTQHSPVRQRRRTNSQDDSPSKTIQQTAFKSGRRTSPPRTPPQGPLRLRTSRHSTTIRHVLPQSFLDDLTPIDGNTRALENGDSAEDPHDLSLSPRHATRASILDNMLLSLDQFSNIGFEDAPPTITNYYPTAPAPENPRRFAHSRHNRNRGHTLSSSLSSEQDYRNEDQLNRHIVESRGRRSNSSSNFQTGPKRMPSIRANDEPTQRSKVYAAQRAVPRTERVSKTHTRGKSSKSSGSSSIDLGQMIAGSHIKSSKRRSASFDLGQSFQRYMAGQPFDSDPQGVNAMTAQRIQQLIDAAPEPVIPAGPRRPESPMRSPLTGHFPSQHESNTKSGTRRNSTKSSKPTPSRKGRHETLGTATIRTQEEEMYKLRDGLRNGPSLPVTSPSAPASEQIPLTKERPGFLRRVFGGSSRNASSHQAVTGAKDAQASSEKIQDYNPRPPSEQPATSHGRNTRLKESVSLPHNIEKGTPVITKKPSSFFRRRKKSVSDSALAPPVPVLSPVKTDGLVVSQAPSSPVSSLREVMGPYLAQASTSTKPHQEQEVLQDHKVDQVPSRRANEQPSQRPSSNLGVPERRFHQGPAGLGVDLGDDSFLADSSGNEDPSPSSGPQQSRRPEPIRTSNIPKELSEQQEARPSTMQSPSEQSKSFHSSLSAGTLHSKRPHTNSGTVSKEPNPDRALSSPRLLIPKEDRRWLEADSSDEQSDHPQLSLPIEGPKDSPQQSNSDISSYKSANSTPQVARKTSSDMPTSPRINLVAPAVNGSQEQNAAAVEKATEIFNNRDEDHENVGAWLGEADPERELVRVAFVGLFDWSNQNILHALRGLCARIALKGETQQVDRIIDAFARRWCECNPKHGFKSNDVVHTITYSLLLLNTDLHMADIEQKMTKNQFVKNTLGTIRNVANDSAISGYETIRGGTWPKPDGAVRESSLPTIHSPPHRVDGEKSRPSLDSASPAISSGRPIERSLKEDSGETEAISGPLVSVPFRGSSRAWEGQIELVLKAFYQSIARERLPLFGAVTEASEPATNSTNFLGISGNVLRRTPSTLSKAASEYTRGRGADSRTTGRWTSKGRSRPRLYPMNAMGSARTSFDDQSSIWTPSVNSSTWSKASLGKTLTSMSVESFGSAFPGVEYQKSIGFANALSQAIIRGDAIGSTASDDGIKEVPLLEDESLELTGAPWAKEGLLQHKHHLDGLDKRAKDRNWNQCFAVIEKGWIRLFSFEMNAKTIRQRAKDRNRAGNSGPVGGGNWMDNAEEIWAWQLRQTMASALPPPGYSKQRPHVWALSLPTGAVHLFEVGTPEIVKEFVSSANYWAARMSKEPVFGGVSNMEFGWSDNAINRALIQQPTSSDSNNPPPTSFSGNSNPYATAQQQPSRPSIQSSIRSSFDHYNPTSSSTRRLPADSLKILDWTPPQQSLLPSTLLEVDQLKNLSNYVTKVEEELSKHNELRPAMLLAYSPRSSNKEKALGNWERKSSWLLREIVRVGTYVEALKAAEKRRQEVYAERKEVENEDQTMDEPQGKVENLREVDRLTIPSPSPSTVVGAS